MRPIENHWLNNDSAYRNEMSGVTHDDSLPKWHKLEWEKVELLDTDIDERSEYWVVTTEYNGKTYEGTATYVHDTLEVVEDIELKTE